MKMLLAFYFSSSLFCSAMLDCLNCTSVSGLCSKTYSQPCPPGNLCATLMYNYTIPGFHVNMIGEVHGCLPRAVCHQENPNVLETIYSANVGLAKGFLSISCCESNNHDCIKITEPDSRANGLRCFSCEKLTETACRSSISCVGNQDQCMTGTVLNLANLTIKGCASKSFCDADFHSSTLGDVRCCSGSLCNGSEGWNRQDVGLLLMILTANKLLQ